MTTLMNWFDDFCESIWLIVAIGFIAVIIFALYEATATLVQVI